jgi:hypothetical protein
MRLVGSLYIGIQACLDYLGRACFIHSESSSFLGLPGAPPTRFRSPVFFHSLLYL